MYLLGPCLLLNVRMSQDNSRTFGFYFCFYYFNIPHGIIFEVVVLFQHPNLIFFHVALIEVIIVTCMTIFVLQGYLRKRLQAIPKENRSCAILEGLQWLKGI